MCTSRFMSCVLRDILLSGTKPQIDVVSSGSSFKLLRSPQVSPGLLQASSRLPPGLLQAPQGPLRSLRAPQGLSGPLGPLPRASPPLNCAQPCPTVPLTMPKKPTVPSVFAIKTMVFYQIWVAWLVAWLGPQPCPNRAEVILL